MSVRRDRQTQRRDANIGHIGEALGCRESGASSPGLLVAVVLGHRVNYRPW